MAVRSHHFYGVVMFRKQESLKGEKLSKECLLQEASDAKALLSQETVLLHAEKTKVAEEVEARQRLESLLASEKNKEEEKVHRRTTYFEAPHVYSEQCREFVQAGYHPCWSSVDRQLDVRGGLTYKAMCETSTAEHPLQYALLCVRWTKYVMIVFVWDMQLPRPPTAHRRLLPNTKKNDKMVRA